MSSNGRGVLLFLQQVASDLIAVMTRDLMILSDINEGWFLLAT